MLRHARIALKRAPMPVGSGNAEYNRLNKDQKERREVKGKEKVVQVVVMRTTDTPHLSSSRKMMEMGGSED